MAIIEKAPQRHGDGARKRCDHIALGLLAAAMLLACVACDISVDEVGAIGVCSIESGELLTHGVYAIFLSNDSGFTWVWEGGIEHCLGSSNAQSAETPRGIYTIEGTDIVRAFDGKREIAYSAVVFSERTDYIVVEAATMHWEERKIVIEPQAIHYDERSGNVIAATGLQGVVVGTPEGNWTRVGVGPYQPVDFSVLGRVKRLNHRVMWTMGVALAASFTAFALVISLLQPNVSGWRTFLRETSGQIFAIGSLILAVVITGWFTAVYDEEWIGLTLTAPGVVVVVGSIISILLLRPPLRSFYLMAVCFAVLLLLFELSFFMWMSGSVELGTAKFTAMSLMGMTSVGMGVYIRRNLREDWKSEMDTD